MGKVVMYASVSVDGFIADANDQPGPLFDWLVSGDVPLDDSGEVKVSQTSYDYVWPYWDEIGATVVGRHVFDITDGWEGVPPGGVPHVVVVTHRPEPAGWDAEAPFHFVDGVEAAVTRAQELAGDRTVEVAAGASAYERVHLASAVAETAFSDFLWRDPRPFMHASPYGLGFAAGADLEDGAWLVAPDGVWHAAIDLGFTDLTADVLEADLAQSLDGGRLRLVLRNDDGRYNAAPAPLALAPGGELRLAPGYVTSEGVEVSDGIRCSITSVRRKRSSGSATVEVEAVDGWGLLRAWTAPRQLAWASGERSAFLVLSDLVARAGLHAFGPGSGEATALEPTFTVRPGERGDTAVRRLLGTLPDLARMRGIDLVLFDAASDDEPDASYGADGEAPLLSVAIEDGGQRTGWARVFGGGVFAEVIEEGALASGGGVAIAVDDNLASQPRADARAETLLRRAALETSRGAITVPVHPGHEPGDVVAITDATLGLDAARFRVSEVRLRFDRAARHPRYEQTLSLTEV